MLWMVFSSSSINEEIINGFCFASLDDDTILPVAIVLLFRSSIYSFQENI